MTRVTMAAVSIIVVVLIAMVWLYRDRLMPGAPTTPGSEAPATAAEASGPGGALPTPRAIGNPPRGQERPQIAHVAIVDLDRDGLNDVLVCDSFRNILSWVRQAPRGTFTETTIAGVAAPAHVEAVDFDKDGDLDLVVAALGFLFPNNNRVGSVIILENDGQQRFRSHYIADRIARVADARAADLDGDGDLDVSVAGSGMTTGRRAGWRTKADGSSSSTCCSGCPGRSTRFPPISTVTSSLTS